MARNPTSGLKELVSSSSYYPFGLEMADQSYTTGTANPYRYNGKELQTFMQVAGRSLEWYDYGARFYEPAIGRWQVMDGKAEKYFPLAPYCYAGDNPIRYLDPDGYQLVDANGHIMYTQGGGWTKYATNEAQRIGNAMMQTRAGVRQWNKMANTPYPTTLAISSAVVIRTREDGSKGYVLGNCRNTIDKKTGNVVKSAITIYEGTINSYMEASKKSKDEKALSYQNNTTNNDERIAAVAGHESVHNSDKTNIEQTNDNINNNASNDVEAAPIKVELEILTETGEKNIMPIESKRLEELPIEQTKLQLK